MGCLELSMNSSYTIPSGRRTFNEGEATFTLEWTNFTATNPPTGDTKS